MLPLLAGQRTLPQVLEATSLDAGFLAERPVSRETINGKLHRSKPAACRAGHKVTAVMVEGIERRHDEAPSSTGETWMVVEDAPALPFRVGFGRNRHERHGGGRRREEPVKSP